jgi:hypothetical protein
LLKPPRGVIEIVAVPDCPCTMVIEEGLTLNIRPGGMIVSANAGDVDATKPATPR